jgi:dephospho-CoA kinase
VPKLVIGLIGEIAAGKETFTRNLTEILEPTRDVDPERIVRGWIVSVIHTGNFLREELQHWDQPDTRENLQKLVDCMRAFGDGVVAHALEAQVKASRGVVVYDSVRLDADMELVERHPHRLVYITAPQEIRWDRMRQRKEKAGEEHMSWEEFQRYELASTEILIKKHAASAHFTICNDGDLERFYWKVQDFVSEHIRQPDE